MEFVKKAIYTMAYGLHNMQKDMCKGTHGVCANMSPINGSVLLQYLMNVSFSWNNEMVKFDENGDPPGRYDIMNYQKIDNKYDYVKVGSWINTVLKIDKPVQWGSITSVGSEPPESVCSKPCSRGEIKNIVSEMVQCCWKCVRCKDNAFVINETTCQECSPGYWPNENLTGCDEIPVEYIHWWDTTAVVSMSIACLGFVATFVVMIVFIRHNNTPVVKASTRELSYIIMVGMFLCYATTIVLLARPTKTSCFLSRVLPGLSFSMIYTALVTKTNRIARILAGSKKKIITKKPRFMSATAQVIITLILISIEGTIIATMLFLEPANSKLIYPAIDRVQLTCNTTTLGIIAPLGFDFFLIAMCTVYAVKTRNVPENFNEAKFIGFTMYTTLVIWLAFVPIYFGSSSKVITMCLCISFSAIVALVLLYVPKVYIIIFRPERNNRSAFTTTKDVRCHIGYLTSGTTGVSRNSSQTTSDFSLESPRNHSLDIHVKQRDSSLHSQHRSRSSLNLFERFRLNKQEKNAATIAEHIRAIRAAEALDRKSKVRHTDSGLSSEQPKLAAQRSTSSGDESPGCHEKRKLVGLLKQTYGSETEEITGFDVLQDGLRASARKRLDDASCQTSDDLLDFWIPVRRRRIVRSETLLSTLTPEEEGTDSNGPGILSSYHMIRRDGTGYDAYNKSRCYPTFTELSYNGEDNFVNHSIPSDYHSQINRSHIKPCFSHRNPFDRIEVEYKLPSVESHIDDDDNPEDDIEKESILLGDIHQQKESMSILSNPSFYNKMRRMDHPSRDVITDVAHVSEMTALNSIHSKKSEESLVDGGASSIVEESASSGSEDTPGSGIYRNIIISLGSTRISGASAGNSLTGTSEARASSQKPNYAMLAESDKISSSRIREDLPRSIRLRPNIKEGKLQPS
ncbi:metabotropic glutamate receptor 5-like [Limulus polyphemus]|uniref:Metabotropic glutamate receptor 5-like n=1 Tax=Limulus polyphemus TaxID=6850 RepID=A0ABM1S205_LIMPO|nr:metabotropic glutamate receptor 5-like [Limulus polyphemus]